MRGTFGTRGELWFEIDLIAVDNSVITVDGLLDTGFTDWLAINTEDAEALGWEFLEQEERQTAQGIATFRLYEGRLIIDNQELTVAVVAGDKMTNILMGLPWLDENRLVVDRKADLLILGNE
jgi:predicted aspartyl protease